MLCDIFLPCDAKTFRLCGCLYLQRAMPNDNPFLFCFNSICNLFLIYFCICRELCQMTTLLARSETALLRRGLLLRQSLSRRRRSLMYLLTSLSSREKLSRWHPHNCFQAGRSYLLVKSLQTVSNINLFTSSGIFEAKLLIFILLLLPWCLSVKAQRVSALRGGSAKYIREILANTSTNIWSNDANTKLEHKYKYKDQHKYKHKD